jgi:hypothetical protein
MASAAAGCRRCPRQCASAAAGLAALPRDAGEPRGRYDPRMKGDRVEILVDSGSGTVQRFELVASRAGRRIEVSTGRGVVEVSEVTRGGTPIRSGRFMASRVVAIVEHPALEGDAAGVEETTRRRLGGEGGPHGRGGRDGAGGSGADAGRGRGRRSTEGRDQLELLGDVVPEEPTEADAGDMG